MRTLMTGLIAIEVIFALIAEMHHHFLLLVLGWGLE
jgi:hypothetical protein